jgi:hypothetical protein
VGYAIALTPAIMLAVEEWLDGDIGIQQFIDLTTRDTFVAPTRLV